MARRERRAHLVAEDDGITAIFTTFTNIGVAIWQCFTTFVNFVSSHLLRLSSACHPCSCWAFNQAKNLQDRGESPHQDLANNLKFTTHVMQGNPSSSSCIEDNNEPRPIVSNNVTELVSYETVQFGLKDIAKKFAKELCNGNLPNLKNLNMIVNYAQDCGDEVTRLREVVKSDYETISTLHLELEEERNASASATNETMAMIARLQEEKAAIQMEARQYKRMAEEKALYDQEAMDMLKDVIAKREEELQLEYEANKHSFTSFSCVQGGPFKELLYLEGDSVSSTNDDQTWSPQCHDWDAQSTKEFVQGLLSYFKKLNAKEQNMIHEVIYNSKTLYYSFESNQHINMHNDNTQARNNVSIHNYDDNGVPLLPNYERDGGGHAKEYMSSRDDGDFHLAKMKDKDAPISQKKLDYDDKAKEQNSEERKMSVLEYVLKFEEQFHELEQKKNKGVKGVRALCDQKDNTQFVKGISKRNNLTKESLAKSNEIMVRPNTEDLKTATPSSSNVHKGVNFMSDMKAEASHRNDLGDDLCEEVSVEEVFDVVNEPMTICPRVKGKPLENDEDTHDMAHRMKDVASCPSNNQSTRIVDDVSQKIKGDLNWEDLQTSRSTIGIEERSHTNRVKTEVENIISRLNALESNKQQLKHNIAHLMEEKNEMKLLQKISEHIQNLKNLKKEGVQQPEIYMTTFQNFIQTLCKYALSHCEEPICPLDPSQGINANEGVDSICESLMNCNLVATNL